MREQRTLTHEFVKFAPETLEDGVVYVSIDFATAVHACCCGCGNRVVTPLSPRDWKLNFDGETISLRPSIGNWNFPCRSHYWITHNGVALLCHLSFRAYTLSLAWLHDAKSQNDTTMLFMVKLYRTNGLKSHSSHQEAARAIRSCVLFW